MKIFIKVALVCLAFCYANAAPKEISEDLLSKEDIRRFLHDVGILCGSDKLCNTPINVENTQIAQMNEFFDKFLVNIDELIVLKGLEPAKLHDIFYKERHDLWIGHVTLVMNLTEGLIHRISSLHREGDAYLFLTEETDMIQIKLPIALNKLDFEFNYGVSGMDLHRHGQVVGDIDIVTFLVTISFDLKTLVATLDGVERTNVGSVSLNFSGHVLTDWLLDLASDVAVPYIQDDILNVVETIVRKACEMIVKMINRLTGKL